MNKIVNIHPDITMLKDIKGQLTYGLERFQKMLALIPDMVSIHDFEMNILYSNWRGFAGVPESKRILNTKCYKTYRDYDHICPDCQALSVLKTKKVFHEERELSDGTRVDMRILPILDKHGNVESFVEWVRDLTGFKLQEEILRRQNTLLEGIINAVPDILAIKHPDLSIMRFNSAGYKVLDKTHDEVINKKCYQLIGLNAECEQCATRKSLKTKKMEQMEKYVPNLGIYLDCRSNPVMDKNGNILYIVEQLRDITESKQVEERLKYLSFHDQLTGVYNRTYFENEIKRLNKSREYPITIISMDVEGLKIVNDTLGHKRGDEILKLSTRLLQESLRESDILARTGGDEFVALLPGTDFPAGEKIVSRITAGIEQYNLQTPTEIPLGISIGLSCAENAGRDLATVFKEADDLMYRDKLSKTVTARSRIMRSLMTTLEQRDFITPEHSRRLEELCRTVGEKIGLSEKQLSDLFFLSRVHDLGNVGIPDHILFKRGPLNDEEWKIMRQHPEKGFRIARVNADLAEIADLILKHHERWDGRGYPMGLAGTEIPVECRILAIADAYIVMTSDRPFRMALSNEEAGRELRRCAGTQFDPKLVEVFLKVVDFESRVG